MKKMNWDAITAKATTFTALATIMAVTIYSIQAVYMYSALKTSQGGAEAQFYSLVHQALYEGIYKDEETHDFYYHGLISRDLSLLNNRQRAYLGQERLTYPEIYGYMEMLNTVAILYNAGKIDKENFSLIYKKHIDNAIRALETASKDKDSYKNILLLENKLLQGETDKRAFRHIDVSNIPIAILIINPLVLLFVMWRVLRIGQDSNHLPPVESGNVQRYIVTVAEAQAKQPSEE